MPASSGSALALAARLRALDDHALSRLVTDRGIRQQGIRDFFDLAEALLDRGNVQAALQRLDRPTLALLAVAGDLASTSGAPTAAQLAAALDSTPEDVAARSAVAVTAALLGEESGRFAPWDAVVDQLAAWPAFGLPSRAELLGSTPPAALEPVSESDARFVDRGAGDRAFGTLTAVTELVLALGEEPARQLARGGVALPDARRLAAATGVDSGVESDQIDLLLDIARRAGLAALESGTWTPSESSVVWLEGSRLDRWASLAGAWLQLLPDDLLEVLRQRAHAVWGERLGEYVGWLYPAGGDWIRERLTAVAREAELLGLTGGSTPSTPGAELLLHGVEAASAAMGELFPPEVSQVYVQHDLSVIAPGPLVAAVDARLRGFADVEARGLASTYRVTAASLTRAMIAGETADGIREFLRGVSLTGIPQPLEYLLGDTDARFGTLRVGRLDPGAPAADARDFGMAAYVRSDDSAILRQVAVDQNLSSLGLRPDGEHRLLSRFDSELVYWTLADARYPVVAEDASGRILELRRERRVGAGGALADDTAAILVARVRAVATTTPEETGQAWMARQLESAVKNKAAVFVDVRLPDGTDVEYHLEPAALMNGRLRARDRRADIERTLPLSSITAVRGA